MTIPEKLKRAKAKLDAAKRQQSELSGRKQALLDQLKSKHGLDSPAKARKKLEELRTQIADHRERLNDALEELDDGLAELERSSK